MDWTIPLVVGLYLAGATAFGLWRARRTATANAEEYLAGGRSLGPVVVGLALAAQFMHPSNIIGVAEEAFRRGAFAGWATINLGLAFFIISLGLVARYHSLGLYTASGVLATLYGPGVRSVTSAVQIVALSGIMVVTFVAGASMVSLLLPISYQWSVVASGLVVGVCIAAGGMRYLAGANAVHTLISLLGCGLGAWYGLRGAGGMAGAAATLPPGFLNLLEGGSTALFGAWLLANLGAVGSSQSVVQILGSARSVRNARLGALLASAFLAVAGVLAALAGVTARAVFPTADPLSAYPRLMTLMPGPVAGLVVAGLVGGLLASASGTTLAVSTLLVKDFYVPYLRPGAGSHEILLASRWAALLVGLVPIPFALLRPGLFPVIFLARALRGTLLAVVVAGFYLPLLRRGRANWAIGLGAGTTVSWSLAGHPLGIDSAYISLLVPLLVLLCTRRPEHQLEGDQTV